MCELLEVFSVIYKGGRGKPPGGTISVFDGKRGQIIYRGHPTAVLPSDSTGDQDVKKDVELELTGPYRAMSGDGCVAIVLDLHHDGCKDTDNKPYVAEISLDTYDPSTKYDEAVTKKVRTCRCKNAPIAKVTYALLSYAVEATVEANLAVPLKKEDDRVVPPKKEDDPVVPLKKEDDPVLPPKKEDDLDVPPQKEDDPPVPPQKEDDPPGSYVHKIIARSKLGEVVLFRSDDKDTPIRIPLARSVLAVPLTSSLTINVELLGRSEGDMVKKTLRKTFQPNFDSEPVLTFPFQIGLKLQVKITCSE